MESDFENELVGLMAARLSPAIDVAQYSQLLERTGGSLEALLSSDKNELCQALICALQRRTLRREGLRLLETWHAAGIGVVGWNDPRFPESLKTIADPPFILFYRGNWRERICASRSISIVGARRAQRISCDSAAEFAFELASHGACIVSGLALGIDGAAHRGALESEIPLPTVAVLGNGLHSVYPRYHERLAQSILERGGLLLSQFEPEIHPYPSNFLNRNRIIAALSEGTLVIQASAKSGSLVTARNAIEFGKELFVVPGSHADPAYAGSNELLKHGAYLATGVQDIWDVLPALRCRDPRETNPHAPSSARLSDSATKLLKLVETQESIGVEELKVSSGESERFFEDLLQLELDGLIVRLPGNAVAIRRRAMRG